MDEVLRHYAQQDEAARKYYRRILDGARLAAAVDVGWAGSGALALRALMRKWEIPCEIRGLLAGTNTVHNADADAVEGQLFTGTLDSYVFSAAHNRELWRGHDLRRMHNVIVEVLLSSPDPGFRGFMLDAEGGTAAAVQAADRRSARTGAHPARDPRFCRTVCEACASGRTAGHFRGGRVCAGILAQTDAESAGDGTSAAADG